MISRIIVRLADINGPGRCGQVLRHRSPRKGRATIAIDDTQADLYVAIDRAAERTGRTLDRRIARRPQLASRRNISHGDIGLTVRLSQSQTGLSPRTTQFVPYLP